jgi:hypothetical protein
MLRFVALQWNKIMTGIEDTKSCSSCSRRTRSRFECTQCTKALCDFCSGMPTILPGWLKDHAAEHPHHKDFWSVAPPTISLPSRLERDCHCVEDQSAAAHCDRCLVCTVPSIVSKSSKLTDSCRSEIRRSPLFVHDLQKHLWDFS